MSTEISQMGASSWPGRAEEAWLRALARQICSSPDVADDAVQDVLERALVHGPDGVESPRGWLYRLLTNRLRSNHRSRTRRSARESRFATGLELRRPGADVDEQLAQAELLAMLTEEIARLDAPYRRVVLLHYFQGMSSAEIARAEGIADSTARWRLKVARDRLDVAMRARTSPEQRRVWLLGPGLVFAEAGGLGIDAPPSTQESTMSLSTVSPSVLFVTAATITGGLAFATVVGLAGESVAAPSTASEPEPSTAVELAAKAPAPAPAAIAGSADRDEDSSAELDSIAVGGGMSSPFVTVEEANSIMRENVVADGCRKSAELRAQAEDQGSWDDDDPDRPDWCTSAAELTERWKADSDRLVDAWKPAVGECWADAEARGASGGRLNVLIAAIRDDSVEGGAVDDLVFVEGSEIMDPELLDCTRAALLSQPLLPPDIGNVWADMDLLNTGWSLWLRPGNVVKIAGPTAVPITFVPDCDE